MTTKVTEKPLQKRVFMFMNLHPMFQLNRVRREFKDESKANVSVYFNLWKKYIKPMLWLYEFMIGKWVPRIIITKADKVKLRRIEKVIGIE